MKFACEAAKRHMLSRGQKPASVTALYTLSSAATHEAVHLLCEMLRLDPDKRIGVVEALNHPYLDEGRLRYHSCMCSCCTNTAGGSGTGGASSGGNGNNGQGATSGSGGNAAGNG